MEEVQRLTPTLEGRGQTDRDAPSESRSSRGECRRLRKTLDDAETRISTILDINRRNRKSESQRTGASISQIEVEAGSSLSIVADKDPSGLLSKGESWDGQYGTKIADHLGNDEPRMN
jgi:hypothetical protein